MTSTTLSPAARRALRTAQLRLGGLALTSLAAGILPWILGGPLIAQLFGIPFLLLGLFCAFATYRLPAVSAEATRRSAAAYPAEPVGCACGGEGCCGGAASEQSATCAPAETAEQARY